MNKKFLALLLSLLITAICTSPALAYAEVANNTENCYMFCIDEMPEIEDGVYKIDIPINLYDTYSNDTSNITNGYPLLAEDFDVYLSVGYDSGSKELKTSISITRNPYVSVTTLLKKVQATFSYQIFNDASGEKPVARRTGDASVTLIVPESRASLVKKFTGVNFDSDKQYISVQVSGTYYLLDGMGAFSGGDSTLPSTR